MKKFVAYVGIAVVLVLLGVGVLITAPMLYNNWLLSRFERSVRRLPFQMLATKKRLGVLWGCGNHCDMQVIAMVKSDLEPTAFAAIVKAHNSVIKLPFSDAIYSPQMFRLHDNQRYYMDSTFCVLLSPDWSIKGFGVHTNIHDYGLEFSETQVLEALLALYPETNYILMYGDQAQTGFSSQDFRAH